MITREKSNWVWLCIMFNSAAKMMYCVSQYHAVQHIGELLQVKISCKLYYTELDIPLNQNSGWRQSCQSVRLQHRQLWQHNLQGGRNTHKADLCLQTWTADRCQSWKNACKPVRAFCILSAKLFSWPRVRELGTRLQSGTAEPWSCSQLLQPCLGWAVPWRLEEQDTGV